MSSSFTKSQDPFRISKKGVISLEVERISIAKSNDLVDMILRKSNDHHGAITLTRPEQSFKIVSQTDSFDSIDSKCRPHRIIQYIMQAPVDGPFLLLFSFSNNNYLCFGRYTEFFCQLQVTIFFRIQKVIFVCLDPSPHSTCSKQPTSPRIMLCG